MIGSRSGQAEWTHDGSGDLLSPTGRRLDRVGVVGWLGADEPQVDHLELRLERHTQDDIVESHQGYPRRDAFLPAEVAVVDRADCRRQTQVANVMDGRPIAPFKAWDAFSEAQEGV